MTTTPASDIVLETSLVLLQGLTLSSELILETTPPQEATTPSSDMRPDTITPHNITTPLLDIKPEATTSHQATPSLDIMLD